MICLYLRPQKCWGILKIIWRADITLSRLTCYSKSKQTCLNWLDAARTNRELLFHRFESLQEVLVVKINIYFCVFYRNNGSYFVHLLNKDWHEQHALKCRSHTLPLQVLECGHFWNLHYCTIIFCLVLFTLPSAEALQRFLERWNKMGELPIQILLCSCSRSKTLQCQQTLSMALHNRNLA